MKRILAAVCVAAWAAGCGGSDAGGSADVELKQPIFDVAEDPTPAEVAADPGATDLAATDLALADEATAPLDPGAQDLPATDVAEADEAAAPTDTAELAAPGSKTAGQYCKEATECADKMSCVAGQLTPAHCNPLGCTSDADCQAVAPQATGKCQALGGYNLCLWTCLSAKCPGDLKCDGYYCG